MMSVAATASEMATNTRGLGGEGGEPCGREREEILTGKEAKEEGEGGGGGGEGRVGKKGFCVGVESEKGCLEIGSFGGGAWGMSGWWRIRRWA